MLIQQKSYRNCRGRNRTGNLIPILAVEDLIPILAVVVMVVLSPMAVWQQQ